jgi:putative Mn2+ efflux pump MntP
LLSKAKRAEMRRQGDRTMKTLIHVAIAVSIVLMPVGYAEAA